MRAVAMFAAIWIVAGAASAAELRTESFDRDPGWDGLNNLGQSTPTRTVEQNFGYDAGKQAIGGVITPDGHPAYYAKEISAATFDTPLQASGKIALEPGGGNTLLGFFNAGTVNEWRTPNSIVFRINGRGDVYHIHVEYATSKWRAGAGIIGRYDKEADRMHPIEIPSGGVHTWTLSYDPAGADGRGIIVATFDDKRAECVLTDGHKADGATFNRFGLLNVVKSADSPGTLWISDLTLNGEAQDFSVDPMWSERNNRATYETEEVRPRFNFGYTPTNFAKGDAPGEIGGLFFRGDCRDAARLAYYGAPLESLTLQQPLHASGKLAFLRGVSDSTTLFGFFNSRRSAAVNPSQAFALPEDCLGISIEGPSSQGFYVYPVYRFQEKESHGIAEGAPLIYPDGGSHTWSLDYHPPASGKEGVITLTLDKTTSRIPVPADHVSPETVFDRFGFVTPWIDGNGQRVYLDDITYTQRQ